MAVINCPTTLECPALPRVSLDQAVVDLLESIALQESALSHILCAESQKMKAAMSMEELDLCKLLEVNDSATNMVHAVANLELVLKEKLEFISNNLYYPLYWGKRPCCGRINRKKCCTRPGLDAWAGAFLLSKCIKTEKTICWNC